MIVVCFLTLETLLQAWPQLQKVLPQVRIKLSHTQSNINIQSCCPSEGVVKF